MSNITVQKDYYLFPRDGVFYVQFRDPVTRKLLPKKSSGSRNRTLAEKMYFAFPGNYPPPARLCLVLGICACICFVALFSFFTLIN